MKALCYVKSDRERQSLYDLTYMWNLRKSDSKTTSRVVVTRHSRVEEVGRYWSKGTNFQL